MEISSGSFSFTPTPLSPVRKKQKKPGTWKLPSFFALHLRRLSLGLGREATETFQGIQAAKLGLKSGRQENN